MSDSTVTLPLLDHAAIEARIPHKGSMCLLDTVVSSTPDEIVCTAISHRAPDNPLRMEGRLGVSALIEYAAQAMAIHGGLLAAGQPAPKAGYLTSIRQVSWQVERIDDIQHPLTVQASRLSGDSSMVMYAFVVSVEGQVLAEGRLSAVLDVQKLTV